MSDLRSKLMYSGLFCPFGSWPMSKVASSNVMSGGMILSLLSGEFAAATDLRSGGVAAATIGVIDTDFYFSTEQSFVVRSVDKSICAIKVGLT